MVLKLACVCGTAVGIPTLLIDGTILLRYISFKEVKIIGIAQNIKYMACYQITLFIVISQPFHLFCM